MIEAPALLLARGGLGVGKTVLARGIADGLGVLDPVTSPSFTLVKEYVGAGSRFVHIDLYRVVDPLELVHLGLEDYIEADVVCYVEWPEILEATESRLADAVPTLQVSVYNVFMSIEPDQSRNIVLEGTRV